MSTFLATTTAGGVAIFAGRAAVALGLGAMIGLERQWRQRMAGLRTNALVALGSALFELLAVQLAGVSGVDATRIAAYVVSGIGFLGAGVILRDLNHGSGLVEVTADLQRYGRDDVALEAAVSRLSLEPSVSSVTWNVVEPAAPLAAADE